MAKALSEKERQRILELRHLGLTYAVIAERMGRSRNAIERLCRKEKGHV